MGPDEFIDAFVQWISVDERVIAAALVGSHARGVARWDSDIDLVLVCHNPQELISNQSWTTQFGSGKTIGVENYALVQSVRVFYDDGPEVEFGITSCEWTDLPTDKNTAEVMLGGLRILYDPEKRMSHAFDFVKNTYGR